MLIPLFVCVLFTVLLQSISTQIYRSKDVFSCFVLHSNQFLEKSGNVLISNIDDVNECLRKCSQAPTLHKIKCKTVMYNVNSKNCVLSKYALEERKIKKSQGLQIDMYENKCDSEGETVRLGLFNEQFRTTSSPNVRHVIATTTQAISNANELRRVHAVKQYQLEQRKELHIFSKIVHADPIQQPISNRMRVRNAKVFPTQPPRPLVDSTSFIQQPVHVADPPIQSRRQRSFENFATCFVKTANRVLAKFEENKLVGITIENCIRQCAQSSSFYCASINYSFGLKICILNGGNLHLNAEMLMYSRDFDYFENTCQPNLNNSIQSSVGFSTKKECYHMYNNSIYNSFDATIVGGLANLESCETECSWSHVRRREKCVAVNWIEMTRGCMLFHKPIDFNLLQPSFKSIFLVNTCFQTENTQGQGKTSKDSDYYDQNS